MDELRVYGSTRAALKDLTALMHNEAEAAHWSSVGFGDLRRYRRFLHAMYAAHLGLGLPAAQCRSDPAGSVRERQLILRLSADLGPGLVSTDVAPEGDMSADFAWGVTYALSGSALGAASILASDTLPVDWPRQYLTAQHNHARVGGVRRVLDALNAAQPDIDGALEGARAVFRIVAGKRRGVTGEQHAEAESPT